MNEYNEWKNEVVDKLAKRGVPYWDSFLESAWRNLHSADYTAMAREAYWLSSQPAERFDAAKRCGCFRCCKFFPPDKIVWDDGIAECPHCGIDAVLPESDDYLLSEEMLSELAEKQFG